MNEVFLCDAVRTPFGRYGGALASIRADDLAAIPIRALIERNSAVDWSAVDDVILGCANQAGEDNRNVGRMALLLAGLPDVVPGTTINRLCGSSLDAIAIAARAIADRANQIDMHAAERRRHHLEQVVPRQAGGHDMGGDDLVGIDGGDQALDQSGLARPDIAGDDDETLAPFQAIGQMPKKVVFVDDRWDQVENLAEALERLGIEFVGIRFSRADDRVKAFDPAIADLQFSRLPKIISDEEAKEALYDRPS